MDVNNLPTGIAVWVPSQDLEECLNMAMKMWQAECPEEVMAWDRFRREKRDSLHNNNGMSRNGDIKEYIEIPSRLGTRIMQMTHKGWMLDKKITNLIKRKWPRMLAYETNESKYI